MLEASRFEGGIQSFNPPPHTATLQQADADQSHGSEDGQQLGGM